ncbi:MAG: CHC2 zinc finger domain-containing protein [bacterium]
MKKTIKEVVESYGVKLWPIGEGILRGACPMHKNVNTPSFTVYEHTNSYFCFGEGIGGDTANFLSKMENISYAEAKKLVDGEVSLIEDVGQMLDSVAVLDQVNYGEQLNFAVSKYCRDLLLNNGPVDKIFKFLQKLDNEILIKPVTYDIMKQVLTESKQLRGDAR